MLIYPDVEKVTYGYNYLNGQWFCCDDGTPEAAQARAKARASIDGNFKPNEEYEKMQFYYPLTTWAVVAISPTSMARCRNTSSMCRLVRSLSRNAITLGTRLISSMPKSWMRRRVCITMVQDIMSRG